MKELKKIILLDLPPPLRAALEEHLTSQAGYACDVTETPDLLVCAAPHKKTLPGVPALPLSFSRPLRLGAVLREIDQMLADPVLYLDDIPLGRHLFRPQEKTFEKGDGETVSLTDREVDILAYLARQQGKAVGKEDLLKKVWKYQAGVDTHTLETHIYRLRQKIEAAAEAPEILVTTDDGYRLQGLENIL